MAETAFYRLLRHNFLGLKFEAKEPDDIRGLDLFLSNNFLTNSSSEGTFFEIPQFSLSVLISFLNSEKAKSFNSLLLTQLHNFLNHATLLNRIDTGKNFEFFQAYFMWLQFFFYSRSTHTIGLNETSRESFQLPLSSLFRHFEAISGPKDDLTLTLESGSVRYESLSSLATDALQDGDIVKAGVGEGD